MTVQLSTLRVAPELDASKYSAGAQEKVAADKAMAASSIAAGQAVTATDAKISQAGDVLARLSRQYEQGYASQQRFNQGLGQLGRGLEAGKISIDGAQRILVGMNQKLGLMGDASDLAAKGQLQLAAAVKAANAQIAGQAIAADTAAAARGRSAANSNFNTANIAAQFQDIAVTSAMGMSPLQIALQQGTQLSAVLGPMGAAGAAKSLGAALFSIVNPVSLITLGLVGATAAAIQYFSTSKDGTKTLDDALEKNRKAIVGLAEAYGIAGVKAEEFGKKSIVALEAGARESRIALEARARLEATALVGMFGSEAAQGRFGRRFSVDAEYSAFAGPIAALQNQIKEGRADFAWFEKAVDNIAATDPIGLRKTGDEIIRMAQAAAQANKELRETSELLKAASRSSVGGPGAMDRAQDAGRAELERLRRMGVDPFGNIRIDAAEEQVATDRRRAAAEAQLEAMLARSPAEKAAAARSAASAQYNAGESAAARADRIDIAGKLALAQAEKSLADARKDRARSLQETLASQQLEISLIGQTAGEVARLRMEYDLTSKLREEASRNGIEADQREIDLIKQKAAEYGRFADEIARTNMVREVQFERDQMFRSPIDQDIAARQRGAGLPVDLNSDIARSIRENERINDLRNGIRGFFDDFQQGLMQGDSFGKALGNAILNALNNVLDNVLNNLADQITSSIVGSLTGGKSGGGSVVGDVLSSVLGGGRKSGANDNYAPGAITRSPLPDIGSGSSYSVANATSFIKQYASAIGIDPSTALRVAKSEGLGAGIWQSNALKNGIREPSYGPLQLLKGGAGTGYPTGLGNAFQRSTGLDPANQANWQQATAFGLDHAKTNGWGAWYGAKAQGITGFDGIDRSASKAVGALDKLSTGSTKAATGMVQTGAASTQAAQGLQQTTGSLSGFSQQLQSFMGSAQGGGSSWFSNLSNMFGGSNGALNFMNSISPLATADILGAGGGWTGLFAKGGAFSGGNVIPFANGGIVDRPTLFPFAKGTGLMGEAGPEAIMPLRRGPNGSLGVAMHGGGAGGGVVVNINNMAGASIQTEERTNSDGSTSIDVLVDRVVADKLSTRGTASNNTVRQQFGVSSALKRR